MAETEAEMPLFSYIVEAGDTLTEIAAMHETSVASLQELNGLLSPNQLLVGQELIIAPGFSGAGALKTAVERSDFVRETIGHSADGHPIDVFRSGNGQSHVVIVGAIHGGYEWNTALLAYRFLVYFSLYPERVPDDVTLHIVPVANPDGVTAVTGEPGPFVVTDVNGDTTVGRLNGNDVDLNRNWGCQWSPVGQWRQVTVSGGSRPISEPENRALRTYLIDVDPEVVIWVHSAAGLLVPGRCNNIAHEASERAAALYGDMAGYPVGEFTAYLVTGDAADWLAQHKIASFTVELTDHANLEFDRNLAGLMTLLEGLETLSNDT